MTRIKNSLEEDAPEVLVEQPTAEKTELELKVTGIVKGQLALTDKSGQHYRISIGEKYKYVKIDDIIYL